MANLQQASTLGTQTDKLLAMTSDGSAEVHNYDNCYDNEIFNMFTQEEQYTEILEPIPEPHQVQQNDNVISDISSVEQEGGTVDQHTATWTPPKGTELRILSCKSINDEETSLQPVPQKVDETNDLSKPVTSNSVPTPQESKIVKHDNVIAPGMFRILIISSPSWGREEKYVPIKVRASVRTNPITVSQPHVVTKKDVNSDSNGLSSTGVDNTAKTRRPQPRSNTMNDRVPSASKSSCNKNKEVEVEEHHRNLLLSKNKKHMSSECKHVKLGIRNDKSEVICAMSLKQCLGYNLFSVGQFCDSDLKVAFRRNTYFVRNLKGDELLKGNRTTNLYTINLYEMASASPICLMAQYFDSVGISHQASSVRTPQQNGVVERRNRMLVEAARTMLIFSRAPISPLYMYSGGFSVIPRDDRERLLGSLVRKSKPGLQRMTSGQISSGLDLTYAPSTITTQKPTEGELDLLFEAMYDDYIGGQPSSAPRTAPDAQAPQALQTPTATTTTADTAPTPTNSSSQATNCPNSSQDVDELETQQHGQHQPATIADKVPNAMFDENTFVNPFATPSTSDAESSSSQYVDPIDMHERLMNDPAWIVSMQEELFSSKGLDVWVLVPLPDIIKPLWYRLGGRIDLKNPSLIVARTGKAIRIFLAYVAHKLFTVFQMDVKLHSCMPHVYKLTKDIYGLKQAQGHGSMICQSFSQNHFFKGTIDPTLFIRRFDDDILVAKPTEKAPHGGLNWSLSRYSGEPLIRVFRRKVGLLVPQCKQDCIALSTRGTQNMCLSCLLVPSHLDADIVNGLWLSLQQDSNLLTSECLLLVFTVTMEHPSRVNIKQALADYPHRALKNKGIVDSGCSRHMTGNKAYLAEFQDFNGGPVAFGGSKGYITGKGKIKTGKLDFEDVCFVKELQHFNLFSVSQMCDKKKKVLFTEFECLVLSSEFKLPDENQVLLKIPRQNNMYSFNLENVVPSGGLACLIAKATTDESNKWHRRLGHVNFKNLNRLVKGNL
ncbi:retrovirus-related pol polyprotein from transposon TNT 1-94, partial [Tanacetum coccineum]